MDDGTGGEETDSTVRADDGQQSSPPVLETLLQMDTEFAALAHPRRRYLLYTLREEPQWSLRELATKIAAWELDTPEETVTTDERNQVYISLLHAHVPKLVDYGVVVFNRESETVTKGQHADQILKMLAGLGGSADSTQQSHAEREYHE